MQHLALWLREPLGTGYVTVSLGSRLSELIGQAGDEAVLDEAAEEVRKVLRTYQASQFEDVKEAREEGTLANFSRAEILDQIVGVKAAWLPGRTGVAVTATIRTGAGSTAAVYVKMG